MQEDLGTPPFGTSLVGADVGFVFCAFTGNYELGMGGKLPLVCQQTFTPVTCCSLITAADHAGKAATRSE